MQASDHHIVHHARVIVHHIFMVMVCCDLRDVAEYIGTQPNAADPGCGGSSFCIILVSLCWVARTNNHVRSGQSVGESASYLGALLPLLSALNLLTVHIRH